MSNTYTLEQVGLHNTKDDCWIVIKNGAYDITEFIPIHPGGATLIFSAAGQDATDYFNELHNPEVLNEIGDDYYIGKLIHSCL